MNARLRDLECGNNNNNNDRQPVFKMRRKRRSRSSVERAAENLCAISAAFSFPFFPFLYNAYRLRVPADVTASPLPQHSSPSWDFKRAQYVLTRD